ncbi:hypothetical protein JCM8208_004379 [Rhodotorula glutinis]
MSTSSTTSSTMLTAPQPHSALPSPPSAANSLPDELLDQIFCNLMSTDTKQHPLYSVCLASRKFYRLALPRLWEVVVLEIDDEEGGDAFVESAQQYGHYTRQVSLVFEWTARDQAYSSYTRVLEHMVGARKVQVVHDYGASGLRWFESVDVYSKIQWTSLEHFGLVSLCLNQSVPLAATMRTVTSLDITESGAFDILDLVCDAPTLMPSLRALAADVWWMGEADVPSALLAQLDMFQTDSDSIGEVNDGEDRVPCLSRFHFFDGETKFITDRPRHVSLCHGIAPGDPDVVSPRAFARYLTSLSHSIVYGKVKSLWLPHDPASIGSPVGDVRVDAAWRGLCAMARGMRLPGRLVGDPVDPRMLPGGQLDFGFWDYAKTLRAAGEV